MRAKLLYSVNENFFKNWSNEMAYVLGFTFADGSLSENTVAWEIQRRDRRILEKINASMNSNYPIKLTKKEKYVRLRVSNPNIIKDLNRFQLMVKKSREFPDVPERFLSHFIRGFLDGDGWICVRHSRSEISIGFASSSYQFLNVLVSKLNERFNLSSNNLRKNTKNTKKTKNGRLSTCYQINWYCRNAIKLIEFLYDGVSKESLCLDRKFDKQMDARTVFQRVKRDVTKWDVEERFGYPLKTVLRDFLYEKEIRVPQIAENIGVKSSTVYEWLKVSKIELPRRERRCLIGKCLNCGMQFKTHRLSKKYCSVECFYASTHTGRAVGCTVCNKQVYRPLWWFKVNRYPLCSIDCERKWKKMLLERGLIQRDDNTGRFLNSNNSVMR
jgi:intein/homing endonuclease